MAEKGKDFEIFALNLARGVTIRCAARRAGIAERTAHKRMVIPEFQARVRELRDQIMKRTIGRIVAHSTAAESKLRKLVDSENEKIALGASSKLLDLAGRFQSQAELEEQLALLASEVAALKATRKK